MFVVGPLRSLSLSGVPADKPPNTLLDQSPHTPWVGCHMECPKCLSHLRPRSTAAEPPARSPGCHISSPSWQLLSQARICLDEQHSCALAEASWSGRLDCRGVDVRGVQELCHELLQRAEAGGERGMLMQPHGSRLIACGVRTAAHAFAGATRILGPRERMRAELDPDRAFHGMGQRA